MQISVSLPDGVHFVYLQVCSPDIQVPAWLCDCSYHQIKAYSQVPAAPQRGVPSATHRYAPVQVYQVHYASTL